MDSKTWLCALVGAWVVSAVAVAGCGIPKEQYDRDLANLRADYERKLGDCEQQRSMEQDDAAARYASLETKQKKCERELAAMRSQGAKLDEGLTKALNRIQELEVVAARQRAVFDRLRQSLDKLIKAGKLSVAVIRGQFVVQMADKILFDSGKSMVKPEAFETLGELTGILSTIEGRRYQVAGHTDSMGEEESNWVLSGLRARSVLKYMLEQGMPPERVSFAGYGQFQPTAPNDTKENRALNRRIEIVLVPDMEEFLAPIEGNAKLGGS